ncbi:hypothetical protein HNR44_003019 [Geomicrobium halophilum]|uniref:Uncharacterized protein n=1 Tax=Geomicrobium halophilum TaxID=549000 RepID=A0A841PQK5_9BACL|nr:hypothetical protein [Geomicrobium halophilum]
MGQEDSFEYRASTTKAVPSHDGIVGYFSRIWFYTWGVQQEDEELRPLFFTDFLNIPCYGIVEFHV